MALSPQKTEAFARQLQDLYRVEAMLAEAMPLMVEQASLLGLKKNLALHWAETDQQKVALQATAKQMGLSLEEGLNTELQQILDNKVSTATGDESLLETAIAVEHFEIRAYEKITAAAKALGLQGVHARLQRSHEEERQALTKLLFLRKTYIEQSSVLGMQPEDGVGMR